MTESILTDARARYFAARDAFWSGKPTKKTSRALERSREHLLKTTKAASVSEALAYIKEATSPARYTHDGKRIVRVRASAKGMGRLPLGGRPITQNVGRGKRSR